MIECVLSKNYHHTYVVVSKGVSTKDLNSLRLWVKWFKRKIK